MTDRKLKKLMANVIRIKKMVPNARVSRGRDFKNNRDYLSVTIPVKNTLLTYL